MALVPQPARAVAQHDDDGLVLGAVLRDGPLPAQVAQRVEEGEPLLLFLQQVEKVCRQ
jgi:hypothetical protein